jgi:hypothetical protein
MDGKVKRLIYRAWTLEGVSFLGRVLDDPLNDQWSLLFQHLGTGEEIRINVMDIDYDKNYTPEEVLTWLARQ